MKMSGRSEKAVKNLVSSNKNWMKECDCPTLFLIMLKILKKFPSKKLVYEIGSVVCIVICGKK